MTRRRASFYLCVVLWASIGMSRASEAASNFTGAGQDNESCLPDYTGPCLPAAPPDLDCQDIAATFFGASPRDPHRLDPDRDGVACETSRLPASRALSPLYVAALAIVLSGGFFLVNRRFINAVRNDQSPLSEQELQALEDEIAKRRRQIERLAVTQAALRDAIATSAEQERAIHNVLVGALESERRLRTEREEKLLAQQRRFNRFSILLTFVTGVAGIALTVWLA